MSYRTIHVKGQDYKWKVGYRYIEIRNADSGNPFSKILKEKPAPIKRWGLIRPDLDSNHKLSIEIFERQDWAQNSFNLYKTSFPDSPQVEMFPMPSKVVPITSAWIKEEILKHLP
jgi:hypothetical protein